MPASSIPHQTSLGTWPLLPLPHSGYSSSETKFSISPAAPDSCPPPTTQGNLSIPHAPGLGEKPGFSQGLRLPPHPAPARPSACSQSRALPAPPQPGQAPSSLPPRAGGPFLPSSQAGLVPLRVFPRASPHCAPAGTALRASAPKGSAWGLEKPTEPAGPGSTHPSAREAGELLRRLLGLRLSSPLPATAVAAAQPPAWSRPAPARLRFTWSPTLAAGAQCPALTRKQLSRPNNNT